MHTILCKLPLVTIISCSGLFALSNDGDSLSDVWEVTYGFSIANGQFPSDELEQADPDGDGKSNLEESIAGTDPYDASVFTAGSVQMPGSFQLVTTGFPNSPNMLEVSWWGAPGKYFWIELSDDLSAGSWVFLPDSFGDAKVFSGADSEIRYLIDRINPLFGTDKLFVRIKVFDLNTYNTVLTDWEYLRFNDDFKVSTLNDTDADSINDNEDAAPFDATVGQLSISIHTPLNGSTIQ
jgi:hypothetical protein